MFMELVSVEDLRYRIVYQVSVYFKLLTVFASFACLHVGYYKPRSVSCCLCWCV